MLLVRTVGDKSRTMAICATVSWYEKYLLVHVYLYLTLYSAKAINYSAIATSSNVKLVHWLMMGGM